jgi:uncharacterized protein
MEGNMDIFEVIQKEAREHFRDCKGSHDWEHTERVLALAEHLARTEGADLEIVRLAAVLHDLARREEDEANGSVDHALRGAEMARARLRAHGLGEETVARVSHCIETHRFRNNLEPKTLEARVVFDADKLDSIGAVGIGRAFLFAGEVGAKLHNPHIDVEQTRPYTEEDTAFREYQVKLRKVQDRILTPEGRRLAQARHDFMVSFFERLQQEVAGRL